MRPRIWPPPSNKSASGARLGGAAVRDHYRIGRSDHGGGPPVEACIALSIVFVAAEIVHGRQGKPGLTARAPWVVAFTFGLLHGLGFASALNQVGLPQQAIPLALLFFNVGVELGQLAFIAVVLAVMAAGRRLPAPTPSWSWRVAPYSIGSLAMFWVIQRIFLF
jgi:hypothetical protein